MKILQDYLTPTETINSDHPAIIDTAKQLTGHQGDDISKSISLFNAVRDKIVYEPLTDFFRKSHYTASNVLARKNGYCVSKACLLCALGRASGIPTRLGLADIINHGASREIVDLMGTNIFTYHGYVEFFLKNKWVKATPAFDLSIYEKHQIPVISFNGREDAVFPSHDMNGNTYVEYIKYHGTFVDLPFADLMESFRKIYTDKRVDEWIELLNSNDGDKPFRKTEGTA